MHKKVMAKLKCKQRRNAYARNRPEILDIKTSSTQKLCTSTCYETNNFCKQVLCENMGKICNDSRKYLLLCSLQRTEQKLQSFGTWCMQLPFLPHNNWAISETLSRTAFASPKTVSRHWRTSSGLAMEHDAALHCSELVVSAASPLLLLLTILTFRQHRYHQCTMDT